MTLILNRNNWIELRQQTPEPQPDGWIIDDFEEFLGVPAHLGYGFNCFMELSPGITLNLGDREFRQDWMLKTPMHDHPIQILVFLLGFVYFDDVHPNLGGMCGYFSGSGVSPAYVEKHRGRQRQRFVDIEIEPHVLKSFLADDPNQHADNLKLLLKEDEWKVSFYPTITSEIRSLAQQLWNAPYRGITKRLYLQAKVFELLALHLNLISADQAQLCLPCKLRPDTIARLHYAKEILATRLKHPPLLSDLAKQVGVSDRTLQRGFRELFGTTVFKHLHNLRMDQAAQLLRNQEMQVSEVAYAVGYCHLGHFAKAFKRKFGMTPKECKQGNINTLS